MEPSVKTGTYKIAFILLFILPYFCAYSQNKKTNSSTDKIIKAEYNYPAEKVIRYLNTSKVVQILDIEGQTMQVNANSVFGCTVKLAGKENNGSTIQFIIDTLAQTVDGPQGSSGGPVSDIKGRAFNIKISPQGKESDYSDAEKVTFTMGASGTTNISQFVLVFFPDVPVDAVKPGDTWNSYDSLFNKTPSTAMSLTVKSVNKFESIEVVNGVECMKITSEFSGIRSMNAQSQGMDIFIKGPYTGTATLLFALKEGYFIKHDVKSNLKGVIQISGPQEISFPMVMDIYSTTEIVK